ncbi:single-stranded-DNA-specific exonuclease RecJ [Desulfatiglans anilini]|uniref:single-stranded-DNA-specific exonuclease RecJ n=1 Tax=Desulfatiglans anilini TaxID=90728 RepID=UPI00040A10C1|nr:single-stranded-DNA-specific exonuclease RecJ [Desulfatiglans anilini]
MSRYNIWKLKPVFPEARELSRTAGLTLLQAHFLVHRGMRDPQTVKDFFDPRLASLQDPLTLPDMGEAVRIVQHAIEQDWKITVYGDYDADGITATAVLIHFFDAIGLKASAYIPNRLREGYGLNREAVRRIAADGTKLLITVDCGSSDYRAIAAAQRAGLTVVVTDHHQVPENYRPPCAVVNAHRSGGPSALRPLAGVGVAFFLAVAIRTALREKGWFKTRKEPDLREYLDLVALGTVADRVPLLGQNRILVNSGLRMMAESRWEGIGAMKAAAQIDRLSVTADDLAFRLAPRLNAPGRLGGAALALEILTVRDIAKAERAARELTALNQERQRLEREILKQIDAQVASMGDVDRLRTLMLCGENWHTGVLGIVASKLVDRYHKPAVVLSLQDGLGIGSGRSIDGFNLFGALTEMAHLFERYGGHAHAAGFALKRVNLDTFRKDLEQLAWDQLDDESLVPGLDIDAVVSLADIDFRTLTEIDALAPFGEGNPEPCLLVRDVTVFESRLVGDNHLKMSVAQDGCVFDAIGFGLGDLAPAKGERVNLAFVPEKNTWQGVERIQLKLLDLAGWDEPVPSILEDARSQLDVLGAEYE